MSKIKLEHLKKYGFELSKSDAQELHHHVNEISQRGDEINEVYPGDDTDDGDFDLVSVDTGDGSTEELKQTIGDHEAYIKLLKGQAEENDKYIGELEAWIEDLKKPTEDVDPDENLQNTGDDQIGSGDDSGSNAIKVIKANPTEHHLTKKKRLKEAGLQEHTITQEDIDSNHPDLADAGVKVGDIIEVPITQ